MICYVTQLESNQVLSQYPVPPMTVLAGLLTDAQSITLLARPNDDIREEIVVTDDTALLETRFVFSEFAAQPDVRKSRSKGDATQ